MEDRHDPVVVAARAVTGAGRVAAAHGARATVGRIEVEPNTTNTVAASTTVWLDARGPDDQIVDRLVSEWVRLVEEDAGPRGVTVSMVRESMSNGVEFDEALGRVIGRALESAGIEATEMPTAAGHDAAILAEHLPAAMLHVRNPTGTSHSPAEHADVADCVIGVGVLVDVLGELACG
jgi:N-carbamoyl-L-amino-acid hydrolase